MEDMLNQKEVDALLKNFKKDVKKMKKKEKRVELHPIFQGILNKFIPKTEAKNGEKIKKTFGA